MKRRRQEFDPNGYAVGCDAWLNRRSLEYSELICEGYFKNVNLMAVNIQLIKAMIQRAYYAGASWQKLRK